MTFNCAALIPFLQTATERLRRTQRTLTAEAMPCLVGREWQGNVRELEHAVAQASGDEMGVCDLPVSVMRSSGVHHPGSGASCGNITHAAEEMGMYRQHLQVKVSKLGIDLEALR